MRDWLSQSLCCLSLILLGFCPSVFRLAASTSSPGSILTSTNEPPPMNLRRKPCKKSGYSNKNVRLNRTPSALHAVDVSDQAALHVLADQSLFDPVNFRSALSDQGNIGAPRILGCEVTEIAFTGNFLFPCCQLILPPLRN